MRYLIHLRHIVGLLRSGIYSAAVGAVGAFVAGVFMMGVTSYLTMTGGLAPFVGAPIIVFHIAFSFTFLNLMRGKTTWPGPEQRLLATLRYGYGNPVDTAVQTVLKEERDLIGRLQSQGIGAPECLSDETWSMLLGDSDRTLREFGVTLFGQAGAGRPLFPSLYPSVAAPLGDGSPSRRRQTANPGNPTNS